MAQIYSWAYRVITWTRCSYYLWYRDEYWTRVWIVQEVLLAQHHLIVEHRGDRFIALRSWDELCTTAWESRPRDMKFETSTARKIWGLKKSLSQQRNKDCQPSILQVLDPRGNCSRTYDRIYAILGLCSEGNRITVDYTLSPVDLAYMVLRSCGPQVPLCGVVAVIQALKPDLGANETGATRSVIARYDVGPSAECDTDIYPNDDQQCDYLITLKWISGYSRVDPRFCDSVSPQIRYGNVANGVSWARSEQRTDSVTVRFAFWAGPGLYSHGLCGTATSGVTCTSVRINHGDWRMPYCRDA